MAVDPRSISGAAPERVNVWPGVAAAILLVVAAAAIAVRQGEPARDQLAVVPPAGSIEPSAPPAAVQPAGVNAASVVFVAGGDLWLYDVATNTKRQMTVDGASRMKAAPRFASPDTVTYLADREPNVTGLWRLGLNEAEPTLLFTGRPILAYDVRGDLIAYLTRDARGRSVLRIWDGRRSRAIRTFAADASREMGPADDVHVAWSADGKRLLVTNTLQWAGKARRTNTVYVVDLAGADARAPQFGTFARWLASGKVVYGSPAGDGLFVWTLEKRPRRVETPASIRIAVSPDGARAVATDRADPATMYLVTGDASARRLGPGESPIWLTPTVLAAGQRDGTAMLFSLDTGQGPALSLDDVSDADVYFTSSPGG